MPGAFCFFIPLEFTYFILVRNLVQEKPMKYILFFVNLFCNLHISKYNFQVVPLTAAVIVTTPQKLAFIDVAKGVRMFSKLKVCFCCDTNPFHFKTFYYVKVLHL